jgi:hypothetical protein
VLAAQFCSEFYLLPSFVLSPSHTGLQFHFQSMEECLSSDFYLHKFFFTIATLES